MPRHAQCSHVYPLHLSDRFLTRPSLKKKKNDRAEILLKAGVHPSIPGKELSRGAFDRVWHHTVDLLQRGFETGSILTVDAEDAVGRTKSLRRYIYNSSRCGKCSGKVKSWDIAGRTCYACESCQPLHPEAEEEAKGTVKKPIVVDVVPFNSHCAKDSLTTRLERGGARLLTVPEIRSVLSSKFSSVVTKKSAKKAELVALLDGLRAPTTNSEDAAKEKADAGEARNVEHIAELAPSQARRAAAGKKKIKIKEEPITPPAGVAKSKSISKPRKKRKAAEKLDKKKPAKRAVKKL